MAMTVKEKQLRQLVVDTAETWVGTKQGDTNHKKIIETYNSIKPLPEGTKMLLSWPWCAASVSAWAQMLGLTEYILPECSCNRMIKLYKSKNQWVEDDTYVPDMGDILFYAWKDKGVGDCELEADHVGIVKEVKNNVIYVIEGNYSKSVKIRQIKVNGKYIRGFGLPNYAKAAIGYKAPVDKTNIRTMAGQVPYLNIDNNNEAVKMAKILFNSLGFNAGTDTIFDEQLENVVKQYQKMYGLRQNGVINRDVWLLLLQGKPKK